MKKQTLKQLEKEKEAIEKKIAKLKEENSDDESKWISIPKTNYEVTKEVLHKGKTFDEIINLKKSNEELLTLEMIGKFLKIPSLVKELKMDSKYSTNDDFFFEQPFETNKEKKYIAQFYSDSDRSGFYCYVDLDYSFGAHGVRWFREKK